MMDFEAFADELGYTKTQQTRVKEATVKRPIGTGSGKRLEIMWDKVRRCFPSYWIFVVVFIAVFVCQHTRVPLSVLDPVYWWYFGYGAGLAMIKTPLAVLRLLLLVFSNSVHPPSRWTRT